jgi:hypothetical protein
MDSRETGVLGKIVTYFGTVETQGRGGLHAHIVIWSGIPPMMVSAAAGHEVPYILLLLYCNYFTIC